MALGAGERKWPPILTSVVAEQLLRAIHSHAMHSRTMHSRTMRSDAPVASVSLDLGVSQERVAVDEDGAHIGCAALSRSVLSEVVASPGKCFELVGGALRPISVFSKATGWVRTLRPTADAPTTVVAGFPMHRIVGTTPLADTQAKVRALGRPRGRVLDTATGLGYTAIELAATASEVVTIELDTAALALARRNPWSAGLFDNPAVRMLTGDATEIVRTFAAGEFAAVLHDPPTMQLGGALYSGAFYAELRRILRPGGRLFHYVGDPGSGKASRTTNGVARRLTAAGFVRVQRHEAAFGVVAVAPRRDRRRRPR